MARKSKGALAREQKQTRKESFMYFMESDPRFKMLNLMQKMAIAQWRKEAIEEGERLAEIDGYELGMIETIACVIQVLTEDYWKKSAPKRIPKFVDDIESLMQSMLNKHVSWEEMADYILENCRFAINKEEMQKHQIPSPAKLFKVVD